MLQKNTELRSIYNFYRGLGQTDTSPLSRLQLWRLLKDCKIHHHGISLTQIDHFIKGEKGWHSQWTGHNINDFTTALYNISRRVILLISLCVSEDNNTEKHFPFTPLQLHGFISCLVIVAYHTYHKDMA